MRASTPAPAWLARLLGEKLRADIPSGLDAGQGKKLVSAWVLVAVNLLPLYGVLLWDWEVFPLLALFWMENVIIGVLNAARMLALDPADGALWLGKLFMVPFFCVHYGIFTAVHGVFAFSMFGDGKASLLEQSDLWLPLGVLAASHLCLADSAPWRWARRCGRCSCCSASRSRST